MNAGTFETVLHTAVPVVLAVGIPLIARYGPLLTTIGVLLVILGLMGLMPVVRIALGTGA